MMPRFLAVTEERAVTKKLLEPIPPGEILFEEFMRPLGISINGQSVPWAPIPIDLEG